MPIYDYKALTAEGKTSKGIVEADSSKTARQKLKKQNLMVTEISERAAAKAPAPGASLSIFAGKVGIREISMTTRQLASLVKANIPLVDALAALVDQTEKDSLKVILAQVRQDVNEGASLSKALAKHPRAFDNIFINMVEAGESSGTLGLVLLRLADLKEAQLRLKNKMVSAMTYPALMLAVAVLLMVGIFTFIIPKLAKVFVDMGKEMPLMTQMLIKTSDILVEYWYLFLATTITTIWMFLRFISSPKGKPKWDAFKLRAPLIGTLVRMVAVTRFANTMGTLLGSGVPILTAMNIAKNLVDNAPISNAIATARENITEGQSIAEPLRRSGEFPPMVIHMIGIGEKTGELPEMLVNVAETYEEQVNARVEGLTALIEPIMIIGMGLMVGFIVMAIFVPLLEMSNIQ